ncbi:MAG: hypothetical protein HRU51_04560 [Xanthomonadales bacterium]|nr:hypothetical protein [Xanthomonadales bacterium]
MRSRIAAAGVRAFQAAALVVLACPMLSSAQSETASQRGDLLALNPEPALFSLLPEPDAKDLARPMSVTSPLSQQLLGSSQTGANSTLLRRASTLSYRADERLSLGAAVDLQQASSFQSVGSIQCVNGTLDAVSYRASECYFIDGPGRASGSTISLGGSYRFGDDARAALNLFQERSTISQRPGSRLDPAQATALLDPRRGAAALPGNRIFGDLNPVNFGLQNAQTERTGVDLEFQVGFSTDQAGDLVLGLQLTRVLDSGVEGVFYTTPGVRNWTIAEPYDAARLSLGWQLGSFAAGIDSYYRSPVSFLEQPAIDGSTSFDVHFTWRAPWNASVSVGASNVLGSSKKEGAGNEPNLSVDPFESIYGRIPYVRYKQDL